MMVKMELNEPIAAAVGLDALLLDRLEAAATDCLQEKLFEEEFL